jgi:hypothetical protein
VPPEWKPRLVTEEPGGCLDITPVPGAVAGVGGQAVGGADASVGTDANGATDALFMIGKCYPGYKFHDAGVYLVQASDRAGLGTSDDAQWQLTRLFPMPFVHRLQSFSHKDSVSLIVASIAETKDSPDDWSKPGTVYAATFHGALEEPDGPSPILADIHKNHGLRARRENGQTVLYISGVEGLYRALVPESSNGSWDFEQLAEGEISELSFIDIDGDGTDELVTIEPFHGNRLTVYRVRWTETGVAAKGALQLTPWLHHDLDYGHGLWTGFIGGRPSILISNRSGSRNLELLQPDTASGDALSVSTVAEGVGSAQIAVLPNGSSDLIFATNQERDEVALYEITA